MDVALESFDFCLLFPLLETVVKREGQIIDLKEGVLNELSLAVSDIFVAHFGLEGSACTIPRLPMLQSMVSLLCQFPLLHAAGRDSISALMISVTDSTFMDEESNDDRRLAESKKSVLALTTELLNGVLADQVAVRESCLFGLAQITVPEEKFAERDVALWICMVDEELDIQEEAKRQWNELHGTKTVSRDLVCRMSELTGNFTFSDFVHFANDEFQFTGNALFVRMLVKDYVRP
jgi:hypothetical protein